MGEDLARGRLFHQMSQIHKKNEFDNLYETDFSCNRIFFSRSLNKQLQLFNENYTSIHTEKRVNVWI